MRHLFPNQNFSFVPFLLAVALGNFYFYSAQTGILWQTIKLKIGSAKLLAEYKNNFFVVSNVLGRSTSTFNYAQSIERKLFR